MNKSEQLAKLLGVEPKIIEEHYTTDCYLNDDINECPHFSCGFGEVICSNPKKYELEGVFAYCYPYTYHKGCCPDNVNFKIIPKIVKYPDFNDPVNFVLLQSLIFEFTGEVFTQRYNDKDSFVDRFLEDTISFLEEPSLTFVCTKREIEHFKQQAQQAEWKY